MKVIVSTRSKYHSFHLAEQLQKRGILKKLLTGLFNPNGNADGYTIEGSKVASNIIPILIAQAPRRIPGLKKFHWTLDYISHEYYDNWAKNQLEPCDIVVGWAGFSLHTIRRAKTLGAVTIVERGAAHILTQKDILEEECARHGIDEKPIDERFIERELQEFAEADFISIPSSFVRRTFVERGIPEEKLIQVPYGVSLEHFRPMHKADDAFRVMHIGGRIQKGTYYLIQAMSELSLANTELLIVGSPRSPIDTLIEEYEGNCKVLDYVPHLELYRTYSQSSVYVLPSVQDGFGMVVIEAMACGVPVICSTNTGGEDIIRDGVDGFVVPTRDVEALKEKILYLYEHEERRRAMGQSALGRAQEFTWDRYGEKIVDEYKSVLVGRKSNTARSKG